MRKTYTGKAAPQALRISADNLWRLPQSILVGTRFRNWRWKPDRTTGNSSKRPWDPISGFNTNGQTLETAVTPEVALDRLDDVTGLGISTGNCGDAWPMVVIDVDYKEFNFRHGPMVELERGAAMPKCVWDFLQELKEAGALLELSISRRGFHAYLAGTLPDHHRATNIKLTERWAAHLVEGVSVDGLARIGLEVYSDRRWLIMTGEIIGEEGESTWTPQPERSQPWLDTFYDQALRRTMVGGANLNEQDISTINDLVVDHCDPTTADPRLADAARVQAFVALWNDAEGAITGGRDSSHSSRRWKLLCWLIAAFRGDTEAAGRAFARSALMNGKCLTRRGTQTLLEYELARARANWDGAVFPQPRAQMATESNLKLQVACWSQEDRDELMFDVLAKAPGTLAQRKALRSLIADIFEAIDAGTYHVHAGLCVPHLGGLTAISERIGGQRTHIMSRLQWLAEAGFLARVERDEATQSPKVYLALSGADCLVLQQGLHPDCPVMPARPASATKKRGSAERQQLRAPRVSAPVVPRHLNAARWTMHVLLSGVRGVAQIAARTGESVRATKRHLRLLEGRGLVSEGSPTVNRHEYEQARLVELAEAQARTRTRRVRDSERWRAVLCGQQHEAQTGAA